MYIYIISPFTNNPSTHRQSSLDPIRLHRIPSDSIPLKIIKIPSSRISIQWSPVKSLENPFTYYQNSSKITWNPIEIPVNSASSPVKRPGFLSRPRRSWWVRHTPSHATMRCVGNVRRNPWGSHGKPPKSSKITKPNADLINWYIYIYIYIWYADFTIQMFWFMIFMLIWPFKMVKKMSQDPMKMVI